MAIRVVPQFFLMPLIPSLITEERGREALAKESYRESPKDQIVDRHRKVGDHWRSVGNPPPRVFVLRSRHSV